MTASGSLAGRIAAACPCVGETACCGSLGGGCAGAGNCLWPGHALEREVEELERGQSKDYQARGGSIAALLNRVAALEAILRDCPLLPRSPADREWLTRARAALKESE